MKRHLKTHQIENVDVDVLNALELEELKYNVTFKKIIIIVLMWHLLTKLHAVWQFKLSQATQTWYKAKEERIKRVGFQLWCLQQEILFDNFAAEALSDCSSWGSTPIGSTTTKGKKEKDATYKTLL
jgi:hypothetical protein